MKIRRFLLENELGQQFDMNNYKESCLLTSPKNLGYSYKSDFFQIGNSFVEDNRIIEQKNPSGTVHFKDYDKCSEFVNFIESSQKLKWVYILPLENEDKTYYRDVSIKEFQKTERKAGIISCPIVFYGLCLWYEQKNIVLTVGEDEGEIRWDFVWDSKFADYTTRNLIFENKGHTEAPIKLEIEGYVNNPSIFVYKNNELTGSLELPVEIQGNEKLIYSTRDTDLYLVKEDANGVQTNLFNVLNPNFINFIKLNKGVNQIKLIADEDITKAKITIYVEYKAV